MSEALSHLSLFRGSFVILSSITEHNVPTSGTCRLLPAVYSLDVAQEAYYIPSADRSVSLLQSGQSEAKSTLLDLATDLQPHSPHLLEAQCRRTGEASAVTNDGI